MAETKYTIRLSSDYGATVLVETDDPATAKGATRWAKQVLDSLTGGQAPEGNQANAKSSDAPICQVHATPMSRQNGRFGSFWSCHAKLPGGEFCSYRPAGE